MTLEYFFLMVMSSFIGSMSGCLLVYLVMRNRV